MRKYSFKGILLSFFLLLFLFSCETEEVLVLETAQEQKQPETLKGNIVDVLSADDIPQVIDRITSITKANKATLGNKVNEEGYFLDTSRILGVTDSVGNKTYALKLYLKNGRENAFYNLIATERSDGEDIPVAILEYIMEPDYFIDRSQGIKRGGGYERTINYYSFRDFSYISLASTGEYHTLPDPCGEFSMDGDGDGSSGTSSGSGGGGSGGGPGSSSGTGGTSYTGGTGPIGVSSGGSTGGGATPDVEVGEGCFCDSFEPSGGDAEKLGRFLTGKDDDCPEGEILLPVNEDDDFEAEYFEDKIDDNNLDPCMKPILNDLKTISLGVGSIVAKFAGNSPGFNWKVNDGTLLGGTGQTNSSYDRATGTVTTTFDSQSWKQATDLSWARTILHESVHAYIIAYTRSDPINAKLTFADLFKDFYKNKYPNQNDTQHAEFARNYVTDISVSLKEYGINNGYALSNQFYEDMAWAGLTDWPKRDSSGNILKDSSGNIIYEETPWFKIAVPNSSDRARIKNTCSIELTGRDTNGNIKPQKGNNAGC